MVEILAIITTSICTYLVWFLQRKFSDNSATFSAVRMLLRREIINQYAEIMQQDTVTTEQLDEIDEVYKLYHNYFRGNGTATKLIEEVRKKPLAF